MAFFPFSIRAKLTDERSESAVKSVPAVSLKARNMARLSSTSVGPTQARATPRRYDRLADEAYRQNVIAYRAVTLVARACGSIPLHIQKGNEILDEHPVLSLIKSPNPASVEGSLISTLTGYYLIAGNAYLVSVGPRVGQPKELWTVRPDTIRIKEGAQGMPASFEQTVGSKKQNFLPETVLHWRSFNPLSDWYGQAPLEAAALAIDQHNEGGRWNLALIQNGGTPSGVLMQEADQDPLTDQQLEGLRDQISERYTGSRNAGRPLLLEGGLKWQDTGRSPKDQDWISGMTMAARDIALAFGVPPQMIGIPDSQTFANYAEARQSLWEDTVIPLAQDLVDQLNSWLVPRFDEKAKIIMTLDKIPALEKKRSEKFSRLADASFMTINEKRAGLGLPPLPGGDHLESGALKADRLQPEEDTALKVPASKG